MENELETLNKILKEEKELLKDWEQACSKYMLESIPFSAKVYFVLLGMVDGLGLAQEIFENNDKRI